MTSVAGEGDLRPEDGLANPPLAVPAGLANQTTWTLFLFFFWAGFYL